MRDPIALSSASRPLNFGVAIGVVFLAAGAFSLSFAALRDLAIRAGIDEALAFVWPLIVDGFIVVATAAAFALKRRGKRATWYPWTAVVIFSGISVAGNALHAIDAPPATIPVAVAAAVSSVPAVSLLVSSHLLVVIVEGRKVERKPARVEAIRETEHHAIDLGRDRPAAHPSPRLIAAEPSIELLERVRELVRNHEAITGASIARIAHVSERTGRRRLEELRRSHPELFSIATVQE